MPLNNLQGLFSFLKRYIKIGFENTFTFEINIQLKFCKKKKYKLQKKNSIKTLKAIFSRIYYFLYTVDKAIIPI